MSRDIFRNKILTICPPANAQEQDGLSELDFEELDEDEIDEDDEEDDEQPPAKKIKA